MGAWIAYFGGQTEETKQSSAGSGISKVGFAFSHLALQSTESTLGLSNRLLTTLIRCRP
jgi:hypothetical protein